MLVWLAAIVCVFIQPRIVMAAGFTTIAVACSMAALVDTSWSGSSFMLPELLIAVGLATAFVGLVVSLVMLLLEMGAVSNVINAATFSGLMHTARLLGGQIGAVILGRFLNVREKFHSNLIGQHVDLGNWQTTERLGAFTAALTPGSEGRRSPGALRRLAQFTGQSPGVHVSFGRRLPAHRVGRRRLSAFDGLHAPQQNRSSSRRETTMNQELRRRLISVGLLNLLGFVTSAAGADVMKLSLPEAVQLALGQNRVLKIARLKVTENERKKDGERAGYFPQLRNESKLLRLTSAGNIQVPRGAFGAVPNAGPVPTSDVVINQGALTLVTSGTTLAQPLTQLIRIRQANRIASGEVAASQEELRKAENEVALQVHTLYYGILVTQLEKQAAEQQAVYAMTHLDESEQDVRNGAALRVTAIESQAGVLESQQAVLTASLHISDLTVEFNDLLGLPLDTRLELSQVAPATFGEEPREEYVRAAYSENPQIRAAMQVVEQARAGVIAAKSAYLPDITAFAHQSYQNGVPFLVHNFGTFGLTFSFDVFDFGKRRSLVREREARLAQAEENLQRLKDSVSVDIERSYNKVERTKSMLQVATEVLKLRLEGERLAENQLHQGLVLISTRRQASAASYKAQAGLLQVQLAHLLAAAELEQAVGRTPGL